MKSTILSLIFVLSLPSIASQSFLTLALPTYSHLLPDPYDMVNFSGIMTLENTPEGVRLDLLTQGGGGFNRSANHVAYILMLATDQSHVYEIKEITILEVGLETRFIFTKGGRLDFNEVYERNSFGGLSFPALIYTDANHPERRIDFSNLPISSCSNILKGVEDDFDSGGIRSF